LQNLGAIPLESFAIQKKELGSFTDKGLNHHGLAGSSSSIMGYCWLL
jgi:hypothetical protein